MLVEVDRRRLKVDVKQSIRYLEESKCDQNQGDSYQETHNEVLNIATKALEKQIPKQVIDVNGDYEPDYDCPTCGTRTRFEHQNYCLECGQKLGW